MLRTVFDILKLEGQIAVALLRIVLAGLNGLARLLERHQKTAPRTSQAPCPPQERQVPQRQCSQPMPTPAVPAPVYQLNPDARRVLGAPDGHLYIGTGAFLERHPRSADLLEMVERMANIARHGNMDPTSLPIAPVDPPAFPLPMPDGELWVARLGKGYKSLSSSLLSQ